MFGLRSKLLTLVVMMMSADFANAELKCQMRYDIRSYMTWFDFGASVALGLYAEPPESIEVCARCQSLGNRLSELHYAVINLEDNRQYWINKENITAMKFFQMLTRLLEVEQLFVKFFLAMKDLATDPVLASLVAGDGGGEPATGFVASEILPTGKNKEPTSPLTLYTIADTLPGSDCKQFGYRLGVLIRLATGTFLYRED